MSTFSIQAGTNSTGPFGATGPYGSGGGEGWASSDPTNFQMITHGVGSSTPSPCFINGDEVGMACFVATPFNAFFVMVKGTVPQNFFTSISFVDKASNVETYATSTATFDTSTFAGYTIWHWPAILNNPFTVGSNYTMTIVSAIPVPNVIGDDLFDATAAITAAGYTLGAVTSANDPTTPAGIVLSQSPVGGTVATPGSAVTLVLSLGPIDPQTLRAIKIVPQVANRIQVQFVYSPLGIL
jgi:PASTA domain